MWSSHLMAQYMYQSKIRDVLFRLYRSKKYEVGLGILPVILSHSALASRSPALVVLIIVERASAITKFAGLFYDLMLFNEIRVNIYTHPWPRGNFYFPVSDFQW